MNHGLTRIGLCVSFCCLASVAHAGIWTSLLKVVAGPLVRPVITYCEAKDSSSFILIPIHQGSSESCADKLTVMVDKLCQKGGIQVPEIYEYKLKHARDYVIDSPVGEYNALACKLAGMKAFIAIGSGVMKRWDQGWFTDKEIEAAAAHELVHIKQNHVMKNLIFSAFVSGPPVLKDFFPSQSIDPLFKNAYGRGQEREADLQAIELIDDPLDLAHFLIKMHCLIVNKPTSRAMFDSLYQKAEQELIRDESSFLASLVEILSDHPLTSQRIAYIKNRKT